MANFFLKVILTISTIPITAIFYGIIKDNIFYYWNGIISFILVLLLGSMIFFWVHVFKWGTPILLRTLTKVSKTLLPIVNYINNTRIIGPIISWCVRAIFFFWFVVLLMGDALVRKILSKTTGIHE